MEDDEKEKKTTKKNQWGDDVPVDPETQQFTEKGGSNDSSDEEEVKPFSFFSGMDWGMTLKEHAIAENQYKEIAEKNAEQIADAEKSMGEKAKALHVVYGDLYELDEALLGKATPEELDELENAISSTEEINVENEKNENEKALLQKQLAEINQYSSNLQYIWKSKWNMTVADYPEFKDKIQAKIDWYKEQLESDNPQYVTTSYPEKIKALEGWGEQYEKYLDVQAKLAAFDAISPKTDLLEGNNAVIAKFQNPNNMYSQQRKNKAIWCQSSDEANKTFIPIAQKQRKDMTEEELDAIIDYTGSGSSTINRPLNAIHHSSGWGSSGKKKAYEQAKLMTDALDKCSSPQDVWLQRGVSEMHFGGIDFTDILTGNTPLSSIVGKEFINNSFMSCGSAKNEGFVSPKLIMNIYCPRGTKMHYVEDVTNVGGEYETIINRGYHFVVKKAVKGKDGKFYVDIDLLAGSDSDRLTDAQMKKLYDKYL